MNFKPMLAADLAAVDNEFDYLRFPMLVSPKLDGVRCIVWEGVAYSRNAKPIRNKFVQKWASAYHNLDGELIVGEPTGGNVLGRSMAVTAIEGEPDFTFHLFDSVERRSPEYHANAAWLTEEFRGEPRIQWVPHWTCQSAAEAALSEETWLTEGYEGIMLRAPDGPYKHGRSTLREGWLIKVKRFTDGEGVVIGLEEAEENTNPATKDELGRTKRSSAKSGKVGKGMVGTIIIRDPKWGEMRLSPGAMTHEDRRMYWAGKDCKMPDYLLIGKRVHWRAFGYGLKDKPRFPRFYGLRPHGT